ncbi:MAG TPA: GAF domain-containing protein [Pirellulales bacterium]|jgi:hypothetical protein|nr:GAF domain-containing protein [Pirellulales bacterium]
MATLATRATLGNRPNWPAPLATQLETSLRAAVDAAHLSPEGPPGPASLRQELQRIFSSGHDRAQRLHAVMALVCRISGALVAAYFERDELGQLVLAAEHRDARLDPGQAPDDTALEQGAALACARSAVQVARVQPRHSAVAVPLGISPGAIGAVSLLLPSLEVHDSRQANIELLLAWLAGWLGDESRRTVAGQAHTAATLVELLLEINQARDMRRALDALAARAPALVGCRQVALGLRRGERTRIAAVTGMAQIQCETELVRALENCLAEALRHDRPIVWPAPPRDKSAPHKAAPDNVAELPAHRQLAAATSSRALASAALRSADGRALGAWVLLADEPFTDPEQTARFLAAAAEPLGASLDSLTRSRHFTWANLLRAAGFGR